MQRLRDPPGFERSLRRVGVARDDPQAVRRLYEDQVEPQGPTPLNPAAREDAAQWAKLVKDAGIQLE